MIQTATQLKAKVRNKSGGDNTKAQTLIRNSMMERFLERCALSKYRNHFILKGGMFVASYVGLDTRATVDIDTTIQALPMSLELVSEILKEITDIPLEDGVSFRITSAKEIMEEQEYPGFRFMMDGFLDRMRQPIKIDISTGDVITPAAIEYSYPLMFEERSISILAYNPETVLGEKMETILSRAEANTRMRDYYDIYVLLEEKGNDIREDILRDAFLATCNKRNTSEMISLAREILVSVKENDTLRLQWDNYRRNHYYVGTLEWPEVISGTWKLAELLKIV